MIKVSVVSTKDIWKYIIKIGVIVATLFIILKIYNYSKKNFETKTINTTQCISYITEEITEMGELKKPNIFEIKPQSMLESEFRMSTTVSSRNITSVDEEDENQDNVGNINTTNNTDDSANQENIDTSNITEVSTDIQTETVASKYKNTYNYEKNGIKIKNETSYDLANMNLSTNITVNSKNILIFHTHTCESYTQTDANKYESTGNYRTTDLNHNVVRVGDELQKYLTSYGHNVIHNKTFHDYPAYTGSYGRSLKTVSGILSQNKDTDVVIDLHRDAIGDDSYAPKVKIGDEAHRAKLRVKQDSAVLHHTLEQPQVPAPALLFQVAQPLRCLCPAYGIGGIADTVIHTVHRAVFVQFYHQFHILSQRGDIVPPCRNDNILPEQSKGTGNNQ